MVKFHFHPPTKIFSRAYPGIMCIHVEGNAVRPDINEQVCDVMHFGNKFP